MAKILLVEDEINIASFIERGLQEFGHEVRVANDGQAGWELVRQEDFQLLILDIIMPKMNGLQLCKQYRQAYGYQSPVIMLTALGTTDDIVNGLDAGADDYMVKPFDFRELNARIKVLLKRNTEQTAPEPEQLTYANLRIDLRQHEVFRGQTPVRLSPKEYNLLVYMTQHAERVISRMEIAENVWNTHFDTGTNFIDVYINYLRKKIDRDFEPKLIHTKPGVGFIFTDKL